MQVLALLYAGAGGVDALRDFEHRALTVLRSHGGTLISAFEPENNGTTDTPDEVHLLEFPSATVFAAYRADPRLEALSDLRANAIARTVVYVSQKQLEYAD